MRWRFSGAKNSSAGTVPAFTPPTPEKQQLMGAIHGNREAMDGFARVVAGVTSPADYFSEDNVGRIFAGAAARA